MSDNPITPQGWMPIETAPKDGREALVGRWVEWEDLAPFWAQWITIFDGGPLGSDGVNGDPPTHWHSLPPAPGEGA